MSSPSNDAFPETEPSELLALPVAALQLSVRANNCLCEHGIKIVAELMDLTEAELLSWSNLGQRTLAEISGVLARYGLRLSQPVEQSSEASPGGPELRSHRDNQSEKPAPIPLSAEDAGLRFLKSLSARDGSVVRDRIVDCTATLEELGQRFSVTRERIRQIEKKQYRRLEAFLGSPEGRLVKELGRQIRTDLGAVIPSESFTHFASTLCPSVEDSGDRLLLAKLLLWIAGPYQRLDTWSVLDGRIREQTLEMLIAGRDNRAWLSPEAAREALQRANIRSAHHHAWLRGLGFFEVDGGWLLKMHNIPDRAEQFLRYRGKPITAEELTTLVDCESVRSLRSRLLEDDRFKRINRQGHFALREWAQYDEYSGIADEIAEEIARQGGLADVQHLIRVIAQRYGVKENSVHQYLSAPMFIKVDKGSVRLRAPDEIRAVRADPRFCAGLYCIDGQWLIRVKVTSETLRGSGRAIIDPALN